MSALFSGAPASYRARADQQAGAEQGYKETTEPHPGTTSPVRPPGRGRVAAVVVAREVADLGCGIVGPVVVQAVQTLELCGGAVPYHGHLLPCTTHTHTYTQSAILLVPYTSLLL